MSMNWLNDKKNQPIIAAAAAVVIVGVGVLMYLTMFRGPSDESSSPETTQTTQSTEVDEMPPRKPPVSSAPVTARAPTAAPPPPGGAQPQETWRDDPFLPVGYKPPRKRVITPPIPDFPFFHFEPPPVEPPDELVAEPPQPIRRLAGVMINDRVCAIIESNGVSQVYQPGQTLQDGLAVVDKIESDKVILKTKTKPSRYLVVRLAAAPSSGMSASSGSSGTESSSPRPSSRPNRYRSSGRALPID